MRTNIGTLEQPVPSGPPSTASRCVHCGEITFPILDSFAQVQLVTLAGRIRCPVARERKRNKRSGNPAKRVTWYDTHHVNPEVMEVLAWPAG